MPDYELLRIIWWLLIGFLLAGFAISDGFDLGVANLLLYAGRTDNERRVIVNTIGPVWEGNQVWFILGGGAIFAAWPYIYAVSFSGFYGAMFLVLCALILRPVAFKFRSKLEHPRWRSNWDYCLFIAGIVPSLVFGIAVGNVIQGVPFYFSEDLQIIYTGTFAQLLKPFPLLCGLISTLMFTMQGACYLAYKTEGDIAKRATNAIKSSALLLLILYLLACAWVMMGIPGYQYSSNIVSDGPSNPLLKTVQTNSGAWIANYWHHTYYFIIPLLVLITASLCAFTAKEIAPLKLFIASSICITAIIATLGIGMFPFILPSSSNPDVSLTVWDSSSSQLTLFVMLIATIIFMPIILAYTSWVYNVLQGKVKIKHIVDDHNTLY